MRTDILDTIVIGAGQAGLGVSYFLNKAGRKHLVLEQGRIGETWLSQRWDSFKLNTINTMNTLPGLAYRGSEPDGFWSAKELVGYFQNYVEQFQLPVRTGIKVVSIENNEESDNFLVKIYPALDGQQTLYANTVVIASGVQRIPKYPNAQAQVPAGITQIHSASYKNPQQLPTGGVLIVGSGQSGCQIAEEAADAGHPVYLCTSQVGRVPRRYRNRDILDWWLDMQFFEMTYASLPDKSVVNLRQPQASGLGRHGHTISYQQLSRLGIVILGSLMGFTTNTILINDDASEHIHFADGFSERMKATIETFISKKGIAAESIEYDPADISDPTASCISPWMQVNIDEANIKTIIWATGYTSDFSWVHLPAFDPNGNPLHVSGISNIPGLFFLGFPWLHSRKSGIIYGIEEDARRIAEVISEKLS